MRHRAQDLRSAGKRFIVATQPYWHKVLPSFYFPYWHRGSRIYWDITESRTMTERVLGLYEPEKYHAMEAFLHGGEVFIDIGSNKGDFALFGARVVGQAGHVIAIEPDPQNCHWLQRSVAINRYENVDIFQIACGDRLGVAPLYRSHKSGRHSLVPGLPGRDKDVISVNVMPLDDLVSQLGLQRRTSVIKIDVEGAEMMVLRGAENTLRLNRNIVILLDIHPTLGVDGEQVFSFLSDIGYVVYREVPPFTAPVADSHDATTVIARSPIRW